MNAYAGDYMDDDFQTANKLASICNNHYQEKICGAYIVGYLDALRLASKSSHITVNDQRSSSISGLTIVREINNAITREAEVGDYSASIVIAAIFKKLGVIDIKF